MLPPRAERDPRGHQGSGTSAAPGGPAGLAWGGKHGDDGGEYSTAGGTNKGRVARGVSVFSCPTSWRSPPFLPDTCGDGEVAGGGARPRVVAEALLVCAHTHHAPAAVVAFPTYCRHFFPVICRIAKRGMRTSDCFVWCFEMSVTPVLPPFPLHFGTIHQTKETFSIVKCLYKRRSACDI